MVEVIKVIDFTDVFVRMKTRILYIEGIQLQRKLTKVELFQIAETFKARSSTTEKTDCCSSLSRRRRKNDAVVKLMKEEFGKIEVVRGGSVGIESINVMERLKERTFLRERKEYYHNYVKKD